MTLPELAEATGLSKSSVQRFTHTLWTWATCADPASKKFSLGPWSLELGMKYVQTSPLVRQSVPSFAQPQLPGNLPWPSPTAWTWCTWRVSPRT